MQHDPEPIRSVQNPKVKRWSGLQQKKFRDAEGAFLVEGAHLVTEALRSTFEVSEVLYVPGSPAAQEVLAAAGGDAGAEWIAVTEQVMGKIADARTPQGVAAVVRKRELAPGELIEAARCAHSGPLIAVDAVQDPGNLGTILRSADAAGAAGVLIGKGAADLYNPKTIRATMGSLFHVPAASCRLEETLPLIRKAGFRIVATALAPSARSLYETQLDGAVCFVFGNEGAGVSPALLELADETVIIPMRGEAESLNVAMAATVLLFEALRQREFCERPKG